MRNFTLLYIILQLIHIEVFAQGETYYHTYRGTDSSILLTEWRVDKESVGELYMVEKVDSLNRVTEIRLMNGDSLFPSNCYNHAIYRFEYYDNIIVQHNLETDTTYSAGIECGSPAKQIYYITGSVIDSIVHFLDYDQYLNGGFTLEAEFRDYLEKEKEENLNGILDLEGCVYGYVFSSSRLNGIAPITPGLNIEYYIHEYSEEAINSPYSIQNSINLRNLKPR